MTQPRRIKRKASVVTPNGTEPEARREPIQVLPGTNWVCERRNADGTIDVTPLIGWEVVDGEPYPLPRSMNGAEWLVRPMTDGDDRQMRTTAARLRPEPPQTQNRNWYR